MIIRCTVQTFHGALVGVERKLFLRRVADLFKSHPVVAILGPRQCGKTTLAKQYSRRFRGKQPVTYLDLEDPTHLAVLDNPKLALEATEGLVVIDEVQRRPDLFPVLRVLVDQRRPHRRFLILGSASRDLIRQGSESLAGRIAYLELPPFSFPEVQETRRLWFRGGFPRAYLARSSKLTFDWLKSFVSTFLERDIPALGIGVPPVVLRRFWMMLAQYHGQTFNASELGRSLAVADTTVRRYLDILTGTFMVRQLQPWSESISKRQVKAPKVYLRDSGVLHSLLGIRTQEELTTHPKLGASWEGFALECILQLFRAEPEEAFFWGTYHEAELDLLLFRGGKRLGFEFKYTDSPRLRPSMKIALEDLKLDRLTVVFPGRERFPLAERIQAVGLDATPGAFKPDA